MRIPSVGLVDSHWCVGTETTNLIAKQYNYILNVGTYLGASASGEAINEGHSFTLHMGEWRIPSYRNQTVVERPIRTQP